MKHLIIVLFFTGSVAMAQPKAIQQIAAKNLIESLKKDLYYLASDALEGRLMASRGDTLASLFISRSFKTNNLIVPYDKGKKYFQNISAQKEIAVKELLTIDGKEFKRWDGWVMDNMQNISVNDMPVVFAGYGLDDSLYNDFKQIDVKGKAVIVLSGRLKRYPKDTSLHITTSTKLSAKLATLKQKGAVIVLTYDDYFSADKQNNEKKDYRPKYINHNHTTDALPFIYISEERINELLSADAIRIKDLQDSINKTMRPASFQLHQGLSINIEIKLQVVHAPNVVGLIFGTDTTSGNIIVSAHHDHLGMFGSDIYHGASDDAAGTAALLQMAALMSDAIHKGIRPKHTIIFLSTTGEEGGDLGSFFYAEHPLSPIKKTIADINLDVLGRIDDAHTGKADSSNYVYALVKDNDEKTIVTALEKANNSLRPVEVNYIYKEASTGFILNLMDTHAFLENSIPCINFFTGATKDAVHTTDTADKINYELLSKQTRLAFLTLWNLANK